MALTRYVLASVWSSPISIEIHVVIAQKAIRLSHWQRNSCNFSNLLISASPAGVEIVRRPMGHFFDQRHGDNDAKSDQGIVANFHHAPPALARAARARAVAFRFSSGPAADRSASLHAPKAAYISGAAAGLVFRSFIGFPPDVSAMVSKPAGFHLSPVFPIGRFCALCSLGAATWKASQDHSHEPR